MQEFFYQEDKKIAQSGHARSQMLSRPAQELNRVDISVTSKKSPNVYKSCPKMISQVEWKILIPLQKLPKNVGDLGNLFVAKGFEKLPKVQ